MSMQQQTQYGERTFIRNHRIDMAACALACAAGVVLLVFFALTAAVSPMNGEDYGLSLAPSDGGLVAHLSRLANFIWAHATTWNARLGELLAIVELALPHGVYVFIQCAAALAFVLVISLLACGPSRNRTHRGYACLLTLAAIYLVWPRLEIFFWETAAAGYLQPLTVSLVLVWLLCDPGRRACIWRGRAGSVGVLVLAFAVGFSFENVSPALVAYLAALAWLARKKSQPDWKLAVLAATAVALGWMCLMLVPSTHHRVVFYQHALHVPPWSWAWAIQRMRSVAGVFISVSWPLTLLAIAGLVAIVRQSAKLRDKTDILLLLLPAALIVGGTVLAPYTEPRAFAFTWAIMLCVTMRGTMLMCRHPHHFARLAAVIAVVAIPVSVSVYLAYADFGRQSAARSRTIHAAAGTDACKSGLPIRPIETSASARVLNNREGWVMHTLGQVGRYYECKLVPATKTTRH